jgi:hypothetical protein
MIKMNILKLVKNHKEYLKENAGSFQKVDINALIKKNPYLGVISQIKPLVIGKVCQWVSLGTMKIYNEVVNSVSVTMNKYNKVEVYFNSKSVNTNFAIDIELSNTYDVIGFPSGEVLSLSKQIVELLLQKGLIKYLETLRLSSDVVLNKLFFYNDYKREDINKQLNTQPKAHFEQGDVLVCKGVIGVKDISGELATVITQSLSKNNVYYYYVEFKNSVLGKNPLENRYWLSIENIDGKISEFEHQLSLISDLEDYELDDDYHIRQLHKEKENRMKNE